MVISSKWIKSSLRWSTQVTVIVSITIIPVFKTTIFFIMSPPKVPRWPLWQVRQVQDDADQGVAWHDRLHMLLSRCSSIPTKAMSPTSSYCNQGSAFHISCFPYSGKVVVWWKWERWDRRPHAAQLSFWRRVKQCHLRINYCVSSWWGAGRSTLV